MASKFYIMNEKMDRWGLNSPAEGVLTDPKGFGIEYKGEYVRVGDRWIVDRVELQQPQPEGKVIFAVNPYNTYQSFINFLNAAKALYLVYQPAGMKTEYFADIDVVKIDKVGYSAGKRMEVPCKFICKSLFYTEEVFEYHIQKADREIRWAFRWYTRFNDQNYVYFDFNNDGHVDSPFSLSFTGYCTNPEMSVYQDGKIIGYVKFNLTLQQNETLVFSTYDDDLKIQVDGKDRMDILDFTNENFFKIPQGNVEIYFRSRAGRMNNINMTLEKYYKGV